MLIGNGYGNYAFEYLYGTASGTQITDAGVLWVYFGGIANGTIVNNTNLGVPTGNGGLIILSGGVANNTQVNDSGIVNVRSGGKETGSTIYSGGLIQVQNGGMEIGATINPGGLLEIQDGGTASGTQVYANNLSTSGSGERVLFGGQSIDDIIYSGGVEVLGFLSANTGVTTPGGTALDATVAAGGELLVRLSGVASGTTVYGLLNVLSGGTATGATINSGGLLVIQNGGTATGTRNYGGFSTSGSNSGFPGEEVLSGGQSIDDTIYSGGIEVLGHFNSNTGITTPGGTAFDTTVLSGGLLRVRLSGVASDTTIESGGLEAVFSGGTTSDTTIKGGTLELQSGSTATGSITFGSVSGGTLQIDGTTMPPAVISGFVPGDTIDLRGVLLDPDGYTIFEADNSVLHVLEDGTSYDLQLDPSANFSGGFSLSADSSGFGTDITATPGLVPGGTLIGQQVSETTAITGYSTSPGTPNPYDAVFKIVTPSGAWGSGFVIGPHTIITAAHVVLNEPFVDVDANGSSIASVSASDIRVDSLYTPSDYSEDNSQYDFAIIEVPGINLSTSYGEFNLMPDYSRGTVNVTGYPEYPPGFGFTTIKLASNQFNDIGTVYRASDGDTVLAEGTFQADNRSLVATGGTALWYQGDSGGPVWVYNGSTVEAVGIVSTNTDNQPFPPVTVTPPEDVLGGVAVQLTSLDVEQINSWEDSFSTIATGQVASNQSVSDGNTLEDLGTAYDTLINSGGVENVYGSDFNAIVNDDGHQYVLAGGTATSTTVNDPGVQIVSSGGAAADVMLNGGEQDVYGTASGTTVNSGGLQIVENGGTASGTIINSGGTEHVVSGGTAVDIEFDGTAGTFDLDNPSGLTGTISDWQVGDPIDFVGTSITSASISGTTLTVTMSGGANTSYQLSGQQSATEPILQIDGNGGSVLELTSVNPPFAITDVTTGVQSLSDGTPYSGPVAELVDQFIYTGTDNLNVAAGVPNTFIHTGSGEDAIDVSNVGGTNVLDGGTNSNFLVGGTGPSSFDTFFVDDRSPSADIWSTVANFHTGDAATVFGITPNGFNTAWVDGQGAAGYTGLTLHVTAPGVPTASLTLSGYTSADLTNGRLTTSYGTETDGTPYLYVHAN